MSNYNDMDNGEIMHALEDAITEAANLATVLKMRLEPEATRE